jgi:protein AFG1
VFQVFADNPDKNLPPHHHISDHMRSVMDDLVRIPFLVVFPFSGVSVTFLSCPFNLVRQVRSMRLMLTFLLWQGLTSDIVGTSSMFTGEEEVFAFARACSRLVQMGSKEWADTAGQL